MSTVAVIMLAYSFTINLFPIYAGLKEKTNSYYKKSIIQSLFLVVFISIFELTIIIAVINLNFAFF